MITRKFKTFSATAFKMIAKATESGELAATVEPVGACEFIAPHATDTIARKQLRAHGIECPRGIQVHVEEVGEHTYGITEEDFLANATVID